MFINKINKFLDEYENIQKEDFLLILEKTNNTWFVSTKLEKDFLLTLILIKFWEKYPDLVFKWWTCLNKIYFPYFRLSEDLDFVINKDIWRTARQTLLKKYEKEFVADLSILWLKLKEERTKYDEHRLAMFTFEYNSIIDNSIETIKIDISLKNNLHLSIYPWEIKSNFIEPLFEEKIFDTHFINCINIKEALAEKIRASLTRTIPAIRDFFDIWFVKNNNDFDFEDKEFISLVNFKLQEVDYKYTIDESKNLLQDQIKTDLEPVLNENFLFDFEEIYNFILSFKK